MIETDLLVIGSGFGGLWAAISAREKGVKRVALVDKASIAMSSQSRLSAGATIYCLPEDDAELWLRSIVEAQDFLCHQDMVADMLATSYSRLQKLEAWGVLYQRGPEGRGYLRLPSRGLRHVKMMVRPHYRDRIGGAAVVDALRRRAVRSRIQQHPRVLITDLLQRDGRVAGAVGVDRTTGEPRTFRARAVLLATADCSFRGNYVCTDPTTGDGFRLAYDTGVRLQNMEFLCSNTSSPQFGFEGTGVALKWGGRLLDREGNSFMRRYHPEGDAAEISFLTQAMAMEAKQGHGPPFFLDMGAAWKERIGPVLSSIGGFMPLNLSKLEAEGIDLGEPQEWSPAVQGLRGGVRTGLDCESDLPGLFAAGMSQALDPGLFNGWSSMRAMWSGERAGRAAARFLRDADPVAPRPDQVADFERRAVASLGRSEGRPPDEVVEHMQRVLFGTEVSLLKNAASLAAALRDIEELRDGSLPELRAGDPHELAKLHETISMIRVAEMYLRASLARTESRAGHFREDHPEPDDARPLAWINLRRDDGGEMVLETEPVPLHEYPVQPDREAGRA
jgi:succinate dehydrogenase/fumarate reductase flavoprotein subunit